MPQNEPSHADEHDEAKEEQAGDRLSKSYSQDVDLSPSSRSKREASKLNLDSPAEERIDWRLLKAAVDASNSLIVIADARQEDTPLIYVNEEFRRFTGYRVDEIIGENCRFLQRRSDGEMDRDQEDLLRLREAIQNGEHARVTLRNYKKDGTPFYNELFISPVFDNADEIAYFIGVQNDVTERVEAARQLEESAKTLSSLFDSAPVLMGIVERRTSEGEDGEATSTSATTRRRRPSSTPRPRPCGGRRTRSSASPTSARGSGAGPTPRARRPASPSASSAPSPRPISPTWAETGGRAAATSPAPPSGATATSGPGASGGSA